MNNLNRTLLIIKIRCTYNNYAYKVDSWMLSIKVIIKINY